MAHENTVLASWNNADASLCVDLFRRPDGSYGYELYRRDPEDGRGWYPVGGFSAGVFPDSGAARAAARRDVPWLGP